ncbi:YrhB domain-containing protein [Amycolatopsis sp. NPDC051758]|uniref:YrhB domain-containing protein n=1 Tax=Amycolatopsis sp. NPDC051758 TaxID=3363935 RepID=UPI003796AEC4
MVLQDAFDAAQRFLDGGIRVRHAVEIVINDCEKVPEGWAFYYDSRAFLEEGDILSALAGNAPVIVPESGEPYLGSMFETE